MGNLVEYLSRGEEMDSIRVVAVPTEVAQYVRTEMKAPRYKHPAFRDMATGYGPCRHCLREFMKGEEERILFTYDAFDGIESKPLPGPVFVHAEECERYPEDGGFPAEMKEHELTLNAYGRGRRLVAQEYVTDGKVEEILEQLLAKDEVDYIHVRDTQAGCYDFRVERG
jgi:hypothetical protein